MGFQKFSQSHLPVWLNRQPKRKSGTCEPTNPKWASHIAVADLVSETLFSNRLEGVYHGSCSLDTRQMRVNKNRNFMFCMGFYAVIEDKICVRNAMHALNKIKYKLISINCHSQKRKTKTTKLIFEKRWFVFRSFASELASRSVLGSCVVVRMERETRIKDTDTSTE